MNNNNGALSFEAVLKGTDFKKELDSMERRVLGFSKSVQDEGNQIDATFRKLGAAAASYLAFSELAQLPGKIATVRGEFQQLEIALNTMLGSREKADKLMNDIIQTAGSTPFGLKDLSAATKQLLAYGSSADSVIGEIRMLGDVASGVSVPIGDLVYLYGTLRSQGRAYAVDIRQFAGRGIPIYAELAKVLKVNVAEVNSLVEAGTVGFAQVEQAFKNMTSGGGMFTNLMDAQSKSILGLKERFLDAVDVMFNDMGKSQEQLIADSINAGTAIVENYQKVLDVLGVMVATYGAYRAAVLAVNFMKDAEATSAAAVAASINAQSGAYAREIALKVKSAQASAQRAAAVASEAIQSKLSAQANLEVARTEVIEAAAKKAATEQALLTARAEVTAARARVAAAESNVAAASTQVAIGARTAAQKELEIAQNALLAASENALGAVKAKNAAVTDFNAKKIGVETAAKTVSTTTNTANTATETANTLAKNANTVATQRLTAFQSLQVSVTRIATATTAAFNATLLANPIVLATTAIVGLIGAMYLLSDSTTAAELAQKSLNKEEEEAAQRKTDLQNKTSSYVSVLQSETATQFQQVQAYRELQKLYPSLLNNMTLQQFRALSIADAQRALNAELDKQQISGKIKQYDDEMKKIDQLQSKVKQLQDMQVQSGAAAGAFVVPLDQAKRELDAARIKAKELGAQINQNAVDAWEANKTDAEKIKYYQDLKKSLEQQKKGVEDNVKAMQVLGSTTQGLKPFFDQLNLYALNKDIDVVTGKLSALMGVNNPKADFGGNAAYWEQIRDNATTTQKKMGVNLQGTKEWNDLTATIRNANKELEKYDNKEKKAKSVRERDKPQPYGSIAYWEQVARKADEAMQKTPGMNNDRIMQLEKVKRDAEAKAEQIRKRNAIKSFDEELTEKRKNYELFQNWVTQYGVESAKKQFPELMKQGASYADYLQNQITKLQNQATVPGVGLIAPEQEQLLQLKVEYDQVTNAITTLDQFRRKLDEIRDSSGTLTQEIEALKALQKTFDLSDLSPDATAMRQQTQEQLNDAIKERKSQLRSWMQSVVGSQEEELAITSKYTNLRAALEEKFANDKSGAYKRARRQLAKEEAQELKDRKDNITLQSKEVKEMTKLIEGSTRDQTKIRLDNARKILEEVKKNKNLEGEAYKKAVEDVRQAEEAHAQHSIQVWGMIGDAISEAVEVLQLSGGAMGEVAGALGGLASQAGNIKQALTFEKDGDGNPTIGMNNYAAAIQGVINMISLLVSASKKRKEAEKQFALERLGYERDYQLSLNKSIGESYKANDSIFVKDVEARIKAGVEQYQDAQKRYQEAIEKLDEGKAKGGQKNAVDGKTVGQMAGSGAAVGTVIGAFFGGIGAPVGAAVGAAVGAIAGLFAKKKKDVYGALLERYPDLIQEGTDGWKEINVEMANALITNNQVDEATKQLLETTIAYGEQMQEAKDQIMEGIQELTGNIGDGIRDALVNAFREGTDAALAFGDAVGKVIADMAAKLLYTQLFAEPFRKLQEEMAQSYGIDGDGSILDDMNRFFQENKDLAGEYTEGLEAINKAMEEAGFVNPFGKTDRASGGGMQGAIQGMSQETASLLAGQFNAIRIHTADTNQIARQMLVEMQQVRANTAYNSNLTLLVDVVAELRNINATSIRGFGL